MDAETGEAVRDAVLRARWLKAERRDRAPSWLWDDPAVRWSVDPMAAFGYSMADAALRVGEKRPDFYLRLRGAVRLSDRLLDDYARCLDAPPHFVRELYDEAVREHRRCSLDPRPPSAIPLHLREYFRPADPRGRWNVAREEAEFLHHCVKRRNAGPAVRALYEEVYGHPAPPNLPPVPIGRAYGKWKSGLPNPALRRHFGKVKPTDRAQRRKATRDRENAVSWPNGRWVPVHPHPHAHLQPALDLFEGEDTKP